jgi:hypothetical protein
VALGCFTAGAGASEQEYTTRLITQAPSMTRNELILLSITFTGFGLNYSKRCKYETNIGVSTTIFQMSEILVFPDTIYFQLL